MRLPHALAHAGIGLALALSLVACGADAADPTSGLPIVSDAWIRPPIGIDRPAAGYLTIENPGVDADTLIGASSPIAGSVEIHESMLDGAGMMAMAPIDQLEIEPGDTVTFEPGGYHLMLLDVSGMPAVGESVELTLSFELAGDIVVQAEVRAG
jgi:copper(I)-binding protein